MATNVAHLMQRSGLSAMPSTPLASKMHNSEAHAYAFAYEAVRCEQDEQLRKRVGRDSVQKAHAGSHGGTGVGSCGNVTNNAVAGSSEGAGTMPNPLQELTPVQSVRAARSQSAAGPASAPVGNADAGGATLSHCGNEPTAADCVSDLNTGAANSDSTPGASSGESGVPSNSRARGLGPAVGSASDCESAGAAAAAVDVDGAGGLATAPAPPDPPPV